MSKLKLFSIDGPLSGCAPANGLSVDSSMIGLEPVADDERFTMKWDRTRVGGKVIRATYKFVKDGDRVLAVHVPELDPKPVEVPALPAPSDGLS